MLTSGPCRYNDGPEWLVETIHVNDADKKAKHRKRPDTAVYTVPEAGAMAGLSRNGSYLAAARGEIPVIRFGTKMVVPKAIWDQKLGLGNAADAPAPHGA
jgi:hypothetical protein